MSKKKAPAAKPADENPVQGPMKITDTLLAMAKARKKSATLEDGVLAFTPAEPAPGVVPAGHKLLAMDEAVTGVAAWGGLSIYTVGFNQGLTFLGYPYLSELAQRPEYRRISEVISTEMTRKWIKLHGKGDADKRDRIDELHDRMKQLNVQGAFRELAEQDGFFGRSHLYIDTGDTDSKTELKTPIGDGWNKLSASKISKGKIKRIKTVEPVWCYPANYNASNPLKPDWYRPETWFVMGSEVHSSRLLTFVGREVPDLMKPAFSFGGLSLSQMAKPYIDNWLRTRASVSDLISTYSVSGLKTNMQGTLQAGGAEMFKRIDLFNALRDNSGSMMIDKETEEWFNVTTPLSTIDQLQAQAQEHMAAICGIPIVKLLGIQPAGLNASSEGEIRCFYDWIAAYQELFFTSNLHRLIGFIMLDLWGEVDEDIIFTFEPLWSLDEKTLAEIRKIEAETDQLLIDSGVITNAEARARVAGDPDTPYAGLNADEVPEPPEDDIEEGEDDGLSVGNSGEKDGDGPGAPKGPATTAGKTKAAKHDPAQAKDPKTGASKRRD